MPPSTCVVSGTLYDLNGDAIEGAIIEAYMLDPTFISTDQIATGKVTTTTDSNGAWSLTLVRTTVVKISIRYSDGGVGEIRKEFSITVPNSATGTFSTLAG